MQNSSNQERRTMNSRTVVCALLGILLAATGLYANFSPNKYVEGLVQMPTAFTTNQGEWQLGFGPVTYGITDHIEIGTDLVNLLFGGFMVGAKVNLMKETHKVPFALGINAGYRSVLFGEELERDSVTHYLSTGLTLSRWLARVDSTTKGRVGFHLNCNYNFQVAGPDTSSTRFRREGFNFGVGFDVFITTHTRIIVEGLTNLENFAPRGVVGVHWAWQNFNLKLGVGGPGTADIPVYPQLGLYWRFGGPLPDGN